MNYRSIKPSLMESAIGSRLAIDLDSHPFNNRKSQKNENKIINLSLATNLRQSLGKEINAFKAKLLGKLIIIY